MKTVTAYKLFRVRKDGTLGPLFIDRKLVYEEGKWIEAKSVPTKGFALRPGFHATHLPHAPHLKIEGREWRRVLLRGAEPHQRPTSQGGLWYTAKFIKVLPADDRELRAALRNVNFCIAYGTGHEQRSN